MTVPYADLDQKREYQRKWRAERKASWFAGKSCVKCGSTNQLELDHIDPAHKTAHRIWSWSQERREAELAKCQVLCKDCHLRKTLEQRPATDHGRGWMYQKYHCRCTLCREWKRQDDASRRVQHLASEPVSKTAGVTAL